MPIICFWATTSTEGSSRWRRFVFYWRTKLNIPKISSYFEEITNAPVSTGFTDFTTNVGVTYDTILCFTIILSAKIRFLNPRKKPNARTIPVHCAWFLLLKYWMLLFVVELSVDTRLLWPDLIDAILLRFLEIVTGHWQILLEKCLFSKFMYPITKILCVLDRPLMRSFLLFLWRGSRKYPFLRTEKKKCFKSTHVVIMLFVCQVKGKLSTRS